MLNRKLQCRYMSQVLKLHLRNDTQNELITKCACHCQTTPASSLISTNQWVSMRFGVSNKKEMVSIVGLPSRNMNSLSNPKDVFLDHFLFPSVLWFLFMSYHQYKINLHYEITSYFFLFFFLCFFLIEMANAPHST